EGFNRAPQRAFFKSMGLTDEDIHKPWVGVASTWNEATPCNLTLDRQADAAKRGVSEAGGTPREFVTIAVSDGIAMGHEGMKASLISREVIADSVELMIRAHCYDAFVSLAGCDKSLPGMLMVSARPLRRGVRPRGHAPAGAGSPPAADPHARGVRERRGHRRGDRRLDERGAAPARASARGRAAPDPGRRRARRAAHADDRRSRAG